MSNNYTRRDRPVEAMQFTGGEMLAAEIDAWLDLWGTVQYHAERFIDSCEPQFIDNETLIPVIQIPENIVLVTDVGDFYVKLGQWIVKQTEGTLLVLGDEAFHHTFVKIEES